MSGIRHSGGGGADTGDGVVVPEGAGLAPCIVSVLGLLGGGVYACVFKLLVGAVCRVEGAVPGGGVMEGEVWEVRPCCLRVQGGRGSPLRLYDVSHLVSAIGDEDVGGLSSYTCVVWGRWRVTVILAASFLRVVVWGMM